MAPFEKCFDGGGLRRELCSRTLVAYTAVFYLQQDCLMSDANDLPDATLAALMRGLAPAGGREADAMLTLFAESWIFSGAYLRCKHCGLSQLASQGARPFNHLPDCATTSAATHPWRTLAACLQTVAHVIQ